MSVVFRTVSQCTELRSVGKLLGLDWPQITPCALMSGNVRLNVFH